MLLQKSKAKYLGYLRRKIPLSLSPRPGLWERIFCFLVLQARIMSEVRDPGLGATLSLWDSKYFTPYFFIYFLKFLFFESYSTLPGESFINN